VTDYFLTPPARIKRAGTTKRFTIDLKSYLRSYWIKACRYGLTDYVRAPSLPGFAYQCTVAGEAGLAEPAWPRTLGSTITDGSITWAAVAPGTNAIDAISGAPTWSQVSPPDSALVIGSQVNTVEETTAPFSGGTSGETYRIRCTVNTAGGDVYVVEFDLEVN
jgi:hypothetical protein